jgi:hypothetical protein
VETLTATTSLRLRTGVRVQLVAGADELALRLLDRTIELAATDDRAVKTVLAGAPFVPADLPGLDAEGQLALARQLLRAGVIVPV